MLGANRPRQAVHKGSELDEQELEEMLDSVAHATKVMSKNKVGALDGL